VRRDSGQRTSNARVRQVGIGSPGEAWRGLEGLSLRPREVI